MPFQNMAIIVDGAFVLKKGGRQIFAASREAQRGAKGTLAGCVCF